MELYRFSLETLFYWLVAFSIYEWVTIYIIVTVSKMRGTKTPVEYYQQLPSWVAVSGDFIYSTAIFITSQLLFRWVEPIAIRYAMPKLPAFFILFLIVQWIFDLTFAQIVLHLPSTFSKYVSYFQRYIKEVTFSAAIADSIWGIGWLLFTLLLMKYVSMPIAMLILVLSLFSWLVVKW